MTSSVGGSTRPKSGSPSTAIRSARSRSTPRKRGRSIPEHLIPYNGIITSPLADIAHIPRLYGDGTLGWSLFTPIGYSAVINGRAYPLVINPHSDRLIWDEQGTLTVPPASAPPIDYATASA